MSNTENDLANVLAGTLLGALIGGAIGLGVCTFVIVEPPFFPGDTIVIGALICAALGYFLGEGFIEWLKENWWWFT